MTTCRTPMKSAAARCSSARFRASAAGVNDRSAVPAAPLVHSTYVTSQPAAAHLATTPPEPISASSGWAKITIALSGIWVTISSLLAVASLGMQRFYRTGQGAVACWSAASLSRTSRTADRDLLRHAGCRSRPYRGCPGGGRRGRARSFGTSGRPDEPASAGARDRRASWSAAARPPPPSSDPGRGPPRPTGAARPLVLGYRPMTTNSLPLSRYKVLDLTRARAGPTCVRQLVDWGAEAIKIEMPGGRTGDGMGGNRHGFDFQNLHRNKRSMTLNLRDSEGVAIFKRLAQTADIVVENYRPGVKERLGIDYKALHVINPRIIYGSISGFGQSGPYRDRPGVDQIAQGMGGLMSITGIPGQGPVRVGIPIADLCSGILLAQGILVALLEREITGEGKWVHSSLLEAMLSMLDFQASRWLMSGEIPPQAGNNHPTGIPTGVFETKDGHINIAAAGDEIYDRFCRAIERPDLRSDPRFATARARSANRHVLMEVLMPVTQQRASAEWIRILNDASVPCGPIYRVDEAFADPQVRHLEMAQPVHSPMLGDLTILGHPVSHGERRNPIRAAAPELGQDNEAILGSLGYRAADIADLAKRGII